MRKINEEVFNHFLMWGNKMELTKGTMIFEPEDFLYMVLQGEVCVMKEAIDSDEFVHYMACFPGDIANIDIVGEDSPEPRYLTTELHHTKVIVVGMREFKKRILPELSTDGLRYIFAQVSRVANVQAKKAHYGKKSSFLIVMETLIDTALNSDRAYFDEKGMTMKFTNTSMGERIGFSREMCGRVMKAMHNKGYVVRNGSKVTIPFAVLDSWEIKAK